MMSRPYDDPRWLALHSGAWTCPCCGEVHQGLFDLVSDQPDCWWREGHRGLTGEITTDTEDLLTADVCVQDGEHFFVRGDIDLPIIGAPGLKFTFSAWSTLSKHNLQLYLDSLWVNDTAGLGPWLGWLSTSIKGYPETLNLACQIERRQGGDRLDLTILDVDHPLAVEQRDGISFTRILDIYALNDHDLRTEYLVA